ncbi:hypothetical protein Bbelb_028940 [Branchiostoma belcheri]|nr:hypothetical protein Bbelb_028940 [Branchiostoma belcheri]
MERVGTFATGDSPVIVIGHRVTIGRHCEPVLRCRTNVTTYERGHKIGGIGQDSNPRPPESGLNTLPLRHTTLLDVPSEHARSQGRSTHAYGARGPLKQWEEPPSLQNPGYGHGEGQAFGTPRLVECYKDTNVDYSKGEHVMTGIPRSLGSTWQSALWRCRRFHRKRAYAYAQALLFCCRRSAVIEAWLAAPNALGAEGIALSSRRSGSQASSPSDTCIVPYRLWKVLRLCYLVLTGTCGVSNTDGNFMHDDLGRRQSATGPFNISFFFGVAQRLERWTRNREVPAKSPSPAYLNYRYGGVEPEGLSGPRTRLVVRPAKLPRARLPRSDVSVVLQNPIASYDVFIGYPTTNIHMQGKTQVSLKWVRRELWDCSLSPEGDDAHSAFFYPFHIKLVDTLHGDTDSSGNRSRSNTSNPLFYVELASTRHRANRGAW